MAILFWAAMILEWREVTRLKRSGELDKLQHAREIRVASRLDDCRGCRFHHKQRTGDDACPFDFLYWGFLVEHGVTLRANPRLGRNVLGLRYLDEDERRKVRRQTQAFLDGLHYSGA